MLFIATYGQSQEENTAQKIHLSLGSKKVGIGFGSFNKYNGIDLTFFNLSDTINGMAIELGNFRGMSNINGLNIGVFGTSALNVNGLNIGFIVSAVRGKMNGFNFSYVISSETSSGFSLGLAFNGTKKSNGISIGGLFNVPVISNGISFGGLVNISREMNGVALGGIINVSRVSNGLLIAPVNINLTRGTGIQVGLYNTSLKLNGIQIGILNHISQNKVPFKTLPLINFNFKKEILDSPIINVQLKSDTLIDPRNARVYKTITIKNTTWLAENLDIQTPEITKFCYDDDSTNCKKFGGLYYIDAALKACPIGWHLPSKAEFDTLINSFGNDQESIYKALLLGGYSHFDGLKGGSIEVLRNDTKSAYVDLNSFGYLWSSTPTKSDLKYFHLFRLAEIDSRASIGRGRRDTARSVRCIKD